MEFNDDYEHKTLGILYFPRNVPTKEAENLYQFDVKGCNCRDECKQNCECLTKSGTYYKYEDILNLEEYKLQNKCTNLPTYECNTNCSCAEICGNRLVQFGPRKGLEVKLCKNINKGYGLFTTKTISSDQFICEYAGEVVTEIDAKSRYKLYENENKANYIFCINEKFGEQNVRTFIDPTIYGNIGRYINHSCNPNCQLVVIREKSTMPVLAIFSKTIIIANNEITYNYGEEQNIDPCKIAVRKECFCNEQNCRKYLPFDPSLK